MTITRRQFARSVPALGVFAVSSAHMRAQQPPGGAVWPTPPPAQAWRDESFPSQHPHLAREIVGVAHRDLVRVKELVTAHPSLAKASWDWGFGDWETALGSASHVGNRPIAEFLIEQGAPPTSFRRRCSASSTSSYARRCPHSSCAVPRRPLAAHARAGGAQADAVFQFINSIGAAAPPVPVVPLSDADRSSLEGRYTFGPGPRDAFSVKSQGNLWGIQRDGGELRGLVHVGGLHFHPVGAPAVRVKFDRAPAVTTLSVLDPDLIVTAKKAG